MGLGMVIRNDAGEVVEAQAVRIPRHLEVEAAEALALLHGLRMVEEKMVENVWWSLMLKL